MTGRNTVKDWHIPFFRYGPIDGETELKEMAVEPSKLLLNTVVVCLMDIWLYSARIKRWQRQ
jgi:hypothetical protein